eukprot:CAMPEP_0179332246 /NCGR_PEP_ID=MMETSP0797-20121207/64624_1 /TAXON_ID=47934 /ORGANISM="Dinophysis acuminata, Strain DAEP01" /LENGTH=66 /DNA_ID=CAMNT_0021045087 /DNA_START=79 /DNA_END=275 /DNA_ORIENTATION=+
MASVKQLIQWLVCASLIGILVMSYVNIIYVPQRREIDGQHATISSLEGVLEAWRIEQRKRREAENA